MRRGDRNRRWVVASFGVGLIAGGCTTALGLWVLSGLVSGVPTSVAGAVVLGVAVLALAQDASLLRLPLPQNARQVPQDVLGGDLRQGALQFGFELGTGVRTYVSAASPYVLAVGVLVLELPLLLALVIGAAFGLGRFLMPLGRLVSADAEAWDQRLQRRMPSITKAAALVALGAMSWVVL